MRELASHSGATLTNGVGDGHDLLVETISPWIARQPSAIPPVIFQ